MREPPIMDEAGLIRRQHEVEHAHLSEAVQALADSRLFRELNASVTITYKDYITHYIRRSLSRCEAMAQQLLRNAVLASQDRASLESLPHLKDASEAQLAELGQAHGEFGAARAALESLNRMRAVVTPLAERHFTLSDWRSSARFDADSMLDERQRFARLLALRPDRTGAPT